MARRDSKAFAEQSPFVAGVFIADDYVISSVASVHSGDLLFDQIHQPRKVKAPADLNAGIVMGLTSLQAMLPKGGWVKSFALAMPGPLQGTGRVASAHRYVTTSSFHRKGQNWSNIDILGALDEAIALSHCDDIFPSDIPVGFLTDAAAYAIGDYCYARTSIPIAPSSSLEASQRDAFWEGTVFAHLIVDEGVGGAVVYKNTLLPSRLHSEIGHLPLRPHVDDSVDGMCNAHAFMGCAESYLSLPSLRKRWGAQVEDDLRDWTDSDPRLRLIAYYLAQLCASMVLVVAPSHISLSGRVTNNNALIDLTGFGLKRLLRSPMSGISYPGYREQIAPDFLKKCNHNDVGIFGCLEDAWRRKSRNEPQSISGVRK